MVDHMRIHLPGPFSVSTHGAGIRSTIENDKKNLRELREAWRSLRRAFTREPKKIKNLRREQRAENERLARQYRRDGTIT